MNSILHRVAVIGMFSWLALFSSESHAQQKTETLGVQTSVPLPEPTVLSLRNPVQDKNFYLLSLIERTPSVQQALSSNEVLQAIAAQQRAKLASGFEEDRAVMADTVRTLLWTHTDIDKADEALQRVYQSSEPLRQMVEGPLRQSGMYVRYNSAPGAELLSKAWRDCAQSINNLINVYGLGEPPRYPKIDSVSYDVNSTDYKAVVNLIFGVLSDDSASDTLFFQPSLRFSLELLTANRRDEAGRFEPMESGQNVVAKGHIAEVDWAKFPYSIILVPGQGPEEADVNLSPVSRLIVRTAARRFREGKAPFILVSGGFVHPNQTSYCEAIEMKKALMDEESIPEDAIIIDPHARHTTTNMRNAARLMYRYGIPFNKPGLITTNPTQSRTIATPAFNERCLRDLGYKPHSIVRRISPFDLVFLPQIESLQADARDPLDP